MDGTPSTTTTSSAATAAATALGKAFLFLFKDGTQPAAVDRAIAVLVGQGAVLLHRYANTFLGFAARLPTGMHAQAALDPVQFPELEGVEEDAAVSLAQ